MSRRQTPAASAPSGLWRIGVISNPLSHRNRSGGLAAIQDLLRGHQAVPHRLAGNPREMAVAMAELAQAGVQVLVINGGDGTVQAALSLLAGTDVFPQLPELVLLPGGRSNISAAAFGQLAPAAHTLRQLLCRGPQEFGRRPLPLLRITETDGTRRYGLLVLAGGVVSAVHACRAYRDRQRFAPLRGGLGTAAWIAGTLLRAVAGTPVIPALAGPVQVDGVAVPAGAHLAVLVTTLPTLTPRIRPWWGEGAGLHSTRIVSPARHLARALPRLLRGQPGGVLVPGNGYFSEAVGELSFQLPGGYQLDGEDYPAAGPVRVAAGPVLTALSP